MFPPGVWGLWGRGDGVGMEGGVFMSLTRSQSGSCSCHLKVLGIRVPYMNTEPCMDKKKLQARLKLLDKETNTQTDNPKAMCPLDPGAFDLAA